MKKHAIALTAAMMIGGMTCAFAQEGPGDKMKGGGGPSVGGPASEGPSLRGGESGGAMKEGPASEGPSMKGPERGAEGGRPDPGDVTGGEGPSKTEGRDKAKAPEKAEKKESAPSKAADDTKSPEPSKKAERESGKKADREAKDKASEPSKTTEGEPDKATKPDSQADSAKKGEEAKPDQEKQTTGEQKGVEEAKKVQLSGEKRDRVQSAFREKADVKHRTDVKIDISVGKRLPRDWDFVPVPIAVVEIVPEYRDYVFVYVEDEYVICDPVTYEVVAVLSASGGPTYAGGGGASQCSASLTLSEDERADIVKSVQIVDEEDISGVTIGWDVPQDIELRSFPEPIVSRTAKLVSCRYFVVEGQIAIVDPDADKVVLLIEQN